MEPPFRPPNRSAAASTAVNIRCRTIGFHAMLDAADMNWLLEYAETGESVDNATYEGPYNPVRLWSVMQNDADGYDSHDDPKTKDYLKLLRYICGTGGRRYINERSAVDGLRPIDVADEIQRCILIADAVEFGVDLNPTDIASPLFRGCQICYSSQWLKLLIQATDLDKLDWIDPETRTTALYQLCRTVAGHNDPFRYADVLPLFFASLGYVDPNHRCFTERPLPTHAGVDRLLTVARQATADFLSDLETTIDTACSILPKPVARIVAEYSQ